MLVLTRRVGEEIVIGDMIRVRIVAVDNQQVRLGLTAPQQVVIKRGEVHQRLENLNKTLGNAENDASALELE